tara:strand:- start:483 stop:956 length:474 start_codon:yes stop_codon:yes gene_type:complete
MANVNPPPALRMPRIILEDREWRDYERNRDVILFQLWQRTGGNIDQIENSKNNITSTSSRVNRNTARINSLELRQFEIVNTINSLTTKDYQVIICKNTVPISITLDPQAIEADEVHIKRRGVSVEVIGTIDGFTNKTISSLNYSMHLIFDGTDWSEI